MSNQSRACMSWVSWFELHGYIDFHTILISDVFSLIFPAYIIQKNHEPRKLLWIDQITTQPEMQTTNMPQIYSFIDHVPLCGHRWTYFIVSFANEVCLGFDQLENNSKFFLCSMLVLISLWPIDGFTNFFFAIENVELYMSKSQTLSTLHD